MWAAMSDCRKPKWSLFIPVLLCLTVLAGCGESAEKKTENSDTGSVVESSTGSPKLQASDPHEVPSSDVEEPDAQEECQIYTAIINSSYGLIDATLANPETISSARIDVFDLVSQKAFYEDIFGEGISREEIDTGHYSAMYDNFVPDFEAYWAANGEGSHPDFEITLTIERTDGETETYVAEHMGGSPEFRCSYDPDTGMVEIRLYEFKGEDFLPVVCGAPEDAVGKTVSVTVLADGQPIPQENYAVDGEAEETEISSWDNPDERQTITQYITVVTALLPPSVYAEAKTSVVLDMELNGHRFTYTSPIA